MVQRFRFRRVYTFVRRISRVRCKMALLRRLIEVQASPELFLLTQDSKRQP